MPEFQPYTIYHLPLLEVAAFVSPAGNAYVVLWWQQVPLGHMWLEHTTASFDTTAFRSSVAKAVTPALSYYFVDSTEQQTAQTAFREGDWDTVQHLFETNKRLQSFSNVHADTQALSVVICTRNRTQALEQCIQALLASNDRDFELVIVDNAPDDNSTEQLVQNYTNVVYIREERKGLDIARNTGAKRAAHELIAFTDDDVTVDQDWIRNVKKSFADPNTMCITGLVIPAELKTEWQYHFEKYLSFNRGYVPLVFDAAYFQQNKDKGVPVWEIGAGANMAFRKAVFESVGYFDERLDVGAAGCSGDSELWYRILAEGYTCRYYPQVFVYHQHRRTKQELVKQLFYYMRGHVASLLIQYERYRHKGNLRRLYKDLPEYYKKRIKHKLLGRYSAEYFTLFTEIRGCFSGWRFYRAHRKKPQI